MNTTINTTPGNGLGFWKILGVIAVGLIVLALLGPIIKGLLWIGVIALAVYGGYMIFRSTRSGSGKGTGPTPPHTY